MRIALCSDEPHPAHDGIISWLEERGHEVLRFGSLVSGHEVDWALAAEEAALAVAGGQADEGIFCCWTGTGASIAANKVLGIRAALCGDPDTAKGARTWNHANVICLSNRLMTDQSARTILIAWFEAASQDDRGLAGVSLLSEVDTRNRRSARKPTDR